MLKEGIIDPAKVTKQALLNAFSIVGLMRTTEALVSEVKEEEKAAAAGAGGPGGVGGMYESASGSQRPGGLIGAALLFYYSPIVMKTAFAAGLAAVLLASLRLPLCRFSEEQITIDVWSQEVRVHGVYRYENALLIPIRQRLEIPLPVDSEHPEPYTLVVRNSVARRILGSYQCEVDIGPRSATVLDLEYRQFAQHQDARYLLATTRPWMLPLRRGVYRIIPHGVTIERSNYPLDFVKTNFMPDHDWEFSWR